MSWVDWLFKIVRGKPATDSISWNDAYRKHIDYLKKELDEKIKEIETYKAKHPENGKEYDIWRAEAEASYLTQIRLLEENRNLKERVIFLEAELTRVKKKHRSMYE